MRRLFPIVTEVVELIEWVEAGIFDVDEEGALRASSSYSSKSGIWRAQAEIVHTELMKVPGVQLNADRRKGIQPIEPKRQRRIDPTHDDRPDVVEYDLQVGDTGGSYATKL